VKYITCLKFHESYNGLILRPHYIHDNYRFRVYIANILSLLLLIVSQDDVQMH